jgi:hypothetical protein
MKGGSSIIRLGRAQSGDARWLKMVALLAISAVTFLVRPHIGDTWTVWLYGAVLCALAIEDAFLAAAFVVVEPDRLTFRPRGVLGPSVTLRRDEVARMEVADDGGVVLRVFGGPRGMLQLGPWPLTPALLSKLAQLEGVAGTRQLESPRSRRSS